MFITLARSNVGDNISTHPDIRCVCTSGQPPQIRAAPRTIRIRGGQKLQLKCRASGRPRPLFSWFRDAEDLSQRAQMSANILFNKFVSRLFLQMFERTIIGQDQGGSTADLLLLPLWSRLWEILFLYIFYVTRNSPIVVMWSRDSMWGRFVKYHRLEMRSLK